MKVLHAAPAQDVVELRAPTQHAPVSGDDLRIRDMNVKVLETFSGSPPWNPFKAPWPHQVRARWYNSDVYYNQRFEITHAAVDLKDFDMMFWSPAAWLALLASRFASCLAAMHHVLSRLSRHASPLLVGPGITTPSTVGG